MNDHELHFGRSGPWGVGLSCEDAEVLLADYIDQTLSPEQSSTLELHLASCEPCAGLARDIGMATGFVARAAEVEVPHEMVNRLLFEVTEGPSRSVLKPSFTKRIIQRIFGERAGQAVEDALQPRLVMGMAMTVLSLGLMLRLEPVRKLNPAGLNPTQVWNETEDRVTRMVDRGIQKYQSLPIVFRIESIYDEWRREGAADPAGNERQQQPLVQPDNQLNNPLNNPLNSPLNNQGKSI